MNAGKERPGNNMSPLYRRRMEENRLVPSTIIKRKKAGISGAPVWKLICGVETMETEKMGECNDMPSDESK